MKAEIQSDYGVFGVHEISVDWNGFNFLVIYGQHVNGWFIAIPNWNICIESAGPTEDFYNTEKLSRSFNNITAEAIATAIKEHWEGSHMDNDIIFRLCQLPSTDGNFTSSLRRAKEDEIKCAIEKMQRDTDRKHKSRILACERELRKRKK